MLYATTTPADKRVALRDGLASGRLLRLPGAFNPLSARLIEAKGFDGVYISGAVLAADLGLPDIGLTTATEVTQRAGQIARMTDLPAIVDADTGFGEPMNVARTVQGLEDAGLAGLPHRGPGQPEALRAPRRQGRGRRATPRSSASGPPSTAAGTPNFLIMARTDIRAVDGLAAAIDRAKALVDAGADAIFPEAMTGPRRVRGGARRGRRAAAGQHDRVRQGRAAHRAPARGHRHATSSSTRSRCSGWRWAPR